MANENEKNPSALEELRRLKRTNRIKSLDIHEPELKGFNAENIGFACLNDNLYQETASRVK